MEYKKILAICRKYLGKNYNYRKVVNQLKEYTEEAGFTYDQIAKTLDYWYIVKKQDPSKSGGGIGIVPHIIKEALEYWDEQTTISQALENFNTSVLMNEPKKINVKEAPWQKPQGVYRFF